MILALTSFGFGVCAFAACVTHDYLWCGLLIALTATSVLHHANGTDKTRYIGGSVVGPVEKVLAHGVAVLCFRNVASYGVLGTPAYVLLVFGTVLYYKKLHTSTAYYRGHPMVPVHGTLHVMSQVAILYGYGLKFIVT